MYICGRYDIDKQRCIYYLPIFLITFDIQINLLFVLNNSKLKIMINIDYRSWLMVYPNIHFKSVNK